jgi:hypothetical protein
MSDFSLLPLGEGAKYHFGGFQDMRPCDEVLKRTLRLGKFMVQLADEGDRLREDSGCGVLYGVLRDSGYKIILMAEAEREAHKKKGWWK